MSKRITVADDEAPHVERLLQNLRHTKELVEAFNAGLDAGYEAALSQFPELHHNGELANLIDSLKRKLP